MNASSHHANNSFGASLSEQQKTLRWWETWRRNSALDILWVIFIFFNVQEYFCQLHNITLTVTHFSLCCYALKQLILITQYYILTPVSWFWFRGTMSLCFLTGAHALGSSIPQRCLACWKVRFSFYETYFSACSHLIVIHMFVIPYCFTAAALITSHFFIKCRFLQKVLGETHGSKLQVWFSV